LKAVFAPLKQQTFATSAVWSKLEQQNSIILHVIAVSYF